MLTLWDLILPSRRRARVAEPPPPPAPPARKAPRKRAPTAMEQRYEQITRDMLAQYNIRVRRWRTSMSGLAWEIRYRDGTRSRLIEAPRPKGPMSVAIFLHEVGHHAIGFDRFRPRCLEEYHAWMFALAEMERLGLNITESVRRRVQRSLKYAVGKARRRGLRALPPELASYA